MVVMVSLREDRTAIHYDFPCYLLEVRACAVVPWRNHIGFKVFWKNSEDCNFRNFYENSKKYPLPRNTRSTVYYFVYTQTWFKIQDFIFIPQTHAQIHIHTYIYMDALYVDIHRITSFWAIPASCSNVLFGLSSIVNLTTDFSGENWFTL